MNVKKTVCLIVILLGIIIFFMAPRLWRSHVVGVRLSNFLGCDVSASNVNVYDGGLFYGSFTAESPSPRLKQLFNSARKLEGYKFDFQKDRYYTPPQYFLVHLLRGDEYSEALFVATNSPPDDLELYLFDIKSGKFMYSYYDY